MTLRKPAGAPGRGRLHAGRSGPANGRSLRRTERGRPVRQPPSTQLACSAVDLTSAIASDVRQPFTAFSDRGRQSGLCHTWLHQQRRRQGKTPTLASHSLRSLQSRQPELRECWPPPGLPYRPSVLGRPVVPVGLAFPLDLARRVHLGCLALLGDQMVLVGPDLP